MLHRKINLLLALGVFAAASPAFAQDVALPEPIITPTAKEGEPEIALDVDREIDLANVVTSAAKGVTTVQEAPAIVTIITQDDIKARQFKTINQALSSIPGWYETDAVGNQVNLPIVRGTSQAQLQLRDGVSMFDPWANIAWMNAQVPLENIKRIEVVTGPGGVLWGANSYLGIVNIISKDAEDVNGLEVNARYGDGPGDASHFRAYAMFGKAFWRNRFKIFAHASYDNFVGDYYSLPSYVASSPAPQPPGPAFYGQNTNIRPDRSQFVGFDGKASLGPVTLYWQIPWSDVSKQYSFANTIVPQNRVNIYDRFGILEYKDRFWKDRFGITAKGYFTQFVRDFSVELFPPSGLFPPQTLPGGAQSIGGLHFDFSGQFIYRAGGTVDMDLNLPYGLRLLAGGEAFDEGISHSTVFFKYSPQPLNNLPIYCPVDTNGLPIPFCPRQFINDTSRIVVAGYVDVQWKPHFYQKITLDGGVRLQKGLGDRPYDLTPLYSGSIVWNFLPDFHLKANYATGFRPPVWQNVAAALGGLEYGGSPSLKNETSQSFQGEVNARLLRNIRKVRELELRVDYSYTFLDRLIIINEGTYQNSGKRAIQSAELYAKLYLQGDHFIQLSYTYLNAVTSDSGVHRGVPNHWVSVGGTFNIIKSKPIGGYKHLNPSLDFNFNLIVMGAYEDPNRFPAQGLAGLPVGNNADLNSMKPTEPTTVARTTDLAFDRLTPVALLQLGARVRFFGEKLAFSAQFYNVLNQRYYVPDPFYDLTPSVEMSPTLAPGFSGLISFTYHP